MSDNTDERDLRLNSEDDTVFVVEFSTQWFLFQLGNARVTLRTAFEIVWPGGATEEFDPAMSATNPTSARLLAALMGAKVTRSVAGIEHAYLRIDFDNDLHINYDPTGSDWEDWEVTDPAGILYIALPDDSMTWFEKEAPKADEPELPPVAWYEGDEPRVIDLEIPDHIYGITIYGSSVQLETHGGSIYLAGPFTVTDADGEVFDFDPENLRDDTIAGPLLNVLIDHRVESYILKPDTSEFAVTLKGGGGRLDWKASTPAQAQFSAKLRNGRQFWSKGDGTIYWYGGPEGSHPKFLVGGPKKSD